MSQDSRSETQQIYLEYLSEKAIINDRLHIQDMWPFPLWVKIFDSSDHKFRMLYCNHAYEIFFGISNKRYIGRTDEELHPEADATRFRDRDLKVIQKDGPIIFKEPAKGDRPAQILIKVPITVGQRRGVCGFFLPEELLDGCRC